MHSCIAACNMLSKIFQASHAERLQYITVYPAPKRGQNSAHVCCAQTAGWIKMSLGVQVGLDLSDIVLPGDPAPLPTKGAQLPPIFGPCLLWPNGCMDQDETRHGDRPPVLDGDPAPLPQKGTAPQFSTHVCCGQMAGWIRCHLVRRSSPYQMAS